MIMSRTLRIVLIVAGSGLLLLAFLGAGLFGWESNAFVPLGILGASLTFGWASHYNDMYDALTAEFFP